MIFGHLAVVGIAKLTGFQRESLAVMTLASFGPDILDKPANILFGMPGRGVSHSLVAFSIVIIIAGIYWLKVKWNPRLFAAVVTLWATHLAGDVLNPEILLWPLAGDLGARPRFHVADKLVAYYVKFLHPYQLGFEMTSIIGLFGIILYRLNYWSFPLPLSFQAVNRSGSGVQRS
jgi:membrane-bound metal-dependent hydrolase YbcI (DUF457 family)